MVINTLFLTFLTALFALLLAARVLALDIYVATNGTGSGTSWADATNSLAGAVADIPAESGAVTVWLSNGTHDVVGTVIAPGVETYSAAVLRGKTGIAGDVIIRGDGTNVVCASGSNPYDILRLYDITITGGGDGGVKMAIASNCVITGNSGETCGGVQEGYYYGCIISNNISSAGRGGAFGDSVTLYLENCTIAGNSGALVGGVAFYYGNILRNCVIRGNSAGTGGVGGISGGEVFLYNCLIEGNFASGEGSCGGVVASLGGLYNCTIAGNTGAVGGVGVSGVILYNSISFGNSGDADNAECAEYSEYSCGAGYTGTGSITNDPLFVGSGDYRLQAGSPCINAGTNSTWTTLTDTDLDGNKRRWPANGRPDMGAYEFGSGTVYRKKVMFMKTE